MLTPRPLLLPNWELQPHHTVEKCDAVITVVSDCVDELLGDHGEQHRLAVEQFGEDGQKWGLFVQVGD